MRLEHHAEEVAPQSGLVGGGDMLQQIVEELVVIPRLDAGAALAIDGDLDSVGAGTCHAAMLAATGQGFVKRRLAMGERARPADRPASDQQQPGPQSQPPSHHPSFIRIAVTSSRLSGLESGPPCRSYRSLSIWTHIDILRAE